MGDPQRQLAADHVGGLDGALRGSVPAARGPAAGGRHTDGAPATQHRGPRDEPFPGQHARRARIVGRDGGGGARGGPGVSWRVARPVDHVGLYAARHDGGARPRRGSHHAVCLGAVCIRHRLTLCPLRSSFGTLLPATPSLPVPPVLLGVGACASAATLETLYRLINALLADTEAQDEGYGQGPTSRCKHHPAHAGWRRSRDRQRC